MKAKTAIINENPKALQLDDAGRLCILQRYLYAYRDAYMGHYLII